MSQAETERILAAIDLLAPTLHEAGLEELEVEVSGLRLRLARPAPGGVGPPAATPQTSLPPPPPAASGEESPFGQPAPGMRFATAPLTGIWYAAPSPGARPYVTEGSEIAAGHVIGLIEAMKLFNEIKSDAAGTVTRVLVESGTLVKRNQPLLEIDPR